MQFFAHARVHIRPTWFSAPSRFLITVTTTAARRSLLSTRNLPAEALRRTVTNLHRNTSKMPQTMRAVLIKDGKGSVENLYLGEAPKPSPKPNEVLVKVCP